MLLKHFDSPIPITYHNMVIVHFRNGNPGSVTWGHTSTNNKNDRWYFWYLSLHRPLQEFSTDWYLKYGILYYIIYYNMIYLSVTELLFYVYKYIYDIFDIILSHTVCICIGLSPPTLVPRTSRTHLPIPSRSGQPIAKRPAQKDVFNLTRSSTLAGTVHM